MFLKKAHLFIDGSNFYHALKQNNFFEIFTYSSFYAELSKKFEITKVYYYDATKNRLLEPFAYARQQSFHERLKQEIPQIEIRTRKLKYLLSNEKIENAKNKTGFCANCFKKIDIFLANAGLLKLSKEKGIDIMLVTDLIKGAFQNNYEIALIATGDADFVPAIELVQSLKKQAINIHFYLGSSSELRNACNEHKLIQVDSKGNCYFT